jgi:hypothetical protein
MCEDFASNFGDKRTGHCIMTAHHLTLSFSPPYFSQLKSRHYDIVEVIEAELQAVLNTLREQNFQDAFNKWQKRWKRCMCVEGDYFESNGGQKAQS